jgi:molecular chaperone GrpE (heat shock protein)
VTASASAEAITLGDIAKSLAELNALFQRRLLEDKPKNQLIDQLQRHLSVSYELARGEAFAAVFAELLLVVDRLQREEASAQLNASVVLEMLEILARRGLAPVPVSGAEVVGVRRGGYTLGGRLLRAAQVVVAEPDPDADKEV